MQLINPQIMTLLNTRELLPLWKHYMKTHVHDLFQIFPGDAPPLNSLKTSICNLWQKNYSHFIEKSVAPKNVFPEKYISPEKSVSPNKGSHLKKCASPEKSVCSQKSAFSQKFYLLEKNVFP